MKARRILKRDKLARPVLVCCFVHFAAYDFKADKLPLEMEPVARENNTILMLSRLTQLIIIVLRNKMMVMMMTMNERQAQVCHLLYTVMLNVAPYSFTIAHALMRKARVLCACSKENIIDFRFFDINKNLQ